MKKHAPSLIAELMFWFAIFAFIASIIALSMLPGCAAAQDGSVSPRGGTRAVGDDTATSTQQQGVVNLSYVAAGGAGIAGLAGIALWLRHIRQSDSAQFAGIVSIINSVLWERR